MKNTFFIFVLLVLIGHAENFYVAESTLGSGSGADAANAKSRSWFETAGNWQSPTKTAGKIGPGDTVHLVGTLGALVPQANGTSGNVITILWEIGAKISTTHSDCCYVVNRQYMVFDGGTNGIVECTDNGTHLTYQSVVFGFNASGVDHVTFKNLTIQNLYVHSDDASGLADAGLTGTYVSGIYMNGYGAVTIQDNHFSHIQWCINSLGAAGGMLTITGNDFMYYDHGVGGVGASSGTVAGLVISNNHFGTTRNWDTTAGAYHHDGIHTFWAPGGGGIPNAVIDGNLFDGDWGVSNTAHIFLEQNYITNLSSEAPNWRVTNNVHVQYAGNYLNNGMAILIGDNMTVANNTYVGVSVALSQAVSTGGTNTVFKNNIISGVNRFVDLYNVASGGLDRNIYANPVGGGNPPFQTGGTAYNSFALWQAATGQDANSVTSDPLLDGTYHLQTGSPAIGTGTDLSAYFTTDKAGTARTSPWDIGAYKYGAASFSPAATRRRAGTAAGL